MARTKHRSQLDSIDEINMTPLIDLTFLLLIIFMITAPLLEYGVDVSPPEKNDRKLPEENSKVVNLDKSGKIIFNDRTLTEAELIEELKGLQNSNPKITILLRADGERPYKEVIALLAAIEDAGVKNMSLVTQAESK